MVVHKKLFVTGLIKIICIPSYMTRVIGTYNVSVSSHVHFVNNISIGILFGKKVRVQYFVRQCANDPCIPALLSAGFNTT